MTKKKIHLIGIGGVSMNAIALMLQSEGHIVTGSNNLPSPIVDNLIEKGINVTIGEDASIINDVDIVIYTASISEENSELKKARELNKEIYTRPEFVGKISEDYKNVICIAGTHGKSTTTGMASLVFLENNQEPTIMIGASLKEIDGYLNIGKKDYLILETCEFKDAFLDFKPTSEIILNIDDDHLDYFKNLDNIKKSFTKFTNLLPNDGKLIINADDENTMSLNYKRSYLTYGINSEANFTAKNINYDEDGHPYFDIYFNNEFYLPIHLNVSGVHNIYNTLATATLAHSYSLDKELTKKGIEKYTGVGRRFELLGTYKETIKVYDDYAHHPTEIMSTLDSVKKIKCHQNFAVFQSHTYSRTKEHLEEFASVLQNFDNIIIAPIFAAREVNTYDVHESDIVDLIKKNNKNVIYLESYDKIVDYLKENLEDNDLVITIGAGPVNNVGIKLLA